MHSFDGASVARALTRYGGQLVRRTRSDVGSLRPGTVDAIIIIIFCIIMLFVEYAYDLAPRLFQFAIDYREWEIDNLIFVTFVASIAMVIFSFRRVRELAFEMNARRGAELEAQKLARHDALTGLPNRRFFVEMLGEVLLTTNSDSRSAVLMLDLDGFKSVNDAFGHTIGDQTLIEFAKRISAIMRAGAVLIRVGGDEFAVVVPNIKSLDDPTALARRIVAAVAEPFLIAEISTSVGVGIGIAIAPSDGMEPEILVQRADRALYRAKAEGRSCIRFFESGMDAHVESRIAMETELRAAVAAKTIVPYYQPVVGLEGRRVVGFEALARWKSDKFGWVPPDLFITVAEEIGIINELGDQLLRQACLDARDWPSELTLAFNISAVQLRDSAIGLRVLAILAETGFSPRRLELEITETALVDNMKTAQTVTAQLRQAGVRIALDDFGTGYATLSQLLSLEFDRIKIDRSFIDRLGKDKASTTIVRAVLGLAHGFELDTTAEGIENDEQLASLRADGCLQGQGYLFGKAVSAHEAINVLAKQEASLRVVAQAKFMIIDEMKRFTNFPCIADERRSSS
jgi:diguanylate cyclase (GGDEF)-like protein